MRSRRRRRTRLRPPSPSALSEQAEVFRRQAEQCAGRSPLYADLCRRLANDPRAPDLAAALASPELPRLARRPAQTNEGRRSWKLLPCFLDVTTDEGALRRGLG